jgi:hypothetical protein
MMLPPSPVSPRTSRVQNANDAVGTMAALARVTKKPVATATPKARRLPTSSR